jgi:CBS-domain-containing membrane protein
MLTLGEDEIVVVVDNHPQGVLTQRHLQAILHPAPQRWTARRATDLLPSALPTLLPDTQVAAAAALMTRERVEALAVVDDNGRLLGVVSRRHLDNRLNDRQPHAAATQEPLGPDRCCRWEVPPSPGGPTCRSASGDVVRQSR